MSETLDGIILKPCPLCGGEAVMETVTTAYEQAPRYRVRCTKCGLGGLHWDLWTVPDAAEWWNRRNDDGERQKHYVQR